MAATEVADVPFLRRRKKVKPETASIIHADMRLAELRERVKALEKVKTVVTVTTRSLKTQ